MSITHEGVLEVEQAIAGPDRPTSHFPALVIAQNYLHVGGSVTDSAIQQGTPDSAQVFERGSDVRILEIKAAGGGPRSVDFLVQLQNYGTRPTRVAVTAHVGETPVVVERATLDLLGNAPAERVRIEVPRPQLGELMPECGNETTLYGVELVVTGRR